MCGGEGGGGGDVHLRVEPVGRGLDDSDLAPVDRQGVGTGSLCVAYGEAELDVERLGLELGVEVKRLVEGLAADGADGPGLLERESGHVAEYTAALPVELVRVEERASDALEREHTLSAGRVRDRKDNAVALAVAHDVEFVLREGGDHLQRRRVVRLGGGGERVAQHTERNHCERAEAHRRGAWVAGWAQR